MGKIVLLSTYFLDIPSANGICAVNLADALKKTGNDVSVICYENGNAMAGNNIYTVPVPEQQKAHSTAQKIVRTAKVVLGSTAPIINKTLADNYYRRLCEINNNGVIDAVVAMFFPFESADAICRFKKKNPNVKTVMYEIDSFGDGVSNTDKLYKIYARAYDRFLRKVYSSLDSIIIMKSHEEYWNNCFGADFGHKMQVADLPILVDRRSCPKVNNNGPVKMIYSGLIEKRYRSPAYLLSVLKELHKRIDFEFAFYSKGDCETEISEVSKDINGIKQYGYVTPSELDRAISDSDILVSIGNSVSRSVPSKLISYISYGKPIIHFSSQQNDICKEYLEKYPLAFIVNQSKAVKDSAKEIIVFISSAKGKKIQFSELQKLYKYNVPEFSANIVCKLTAEEENEYE